MKRMNAFTSKITAVMATAALMAGMMTGCGSDAAEDTSAETAETETAETETAETETDEAETAEAETTETEETEETADSTEDADTVVSPYEADLEKYDEIISTLTSGQAYAFADMDEKSDVLLVTDYVYDNLDGNMAAIDATFYAPSEDGSIMEYGKFSSAGTAYPFATKDGYMYVCTGHEVHKMFIDESIGSVVTKEYACETFDEDGNATYSYMSLDDEFEGEVEDDSNLKRLFDEYSQATVVNFTVVE